jgi:hypothetical protein
MVEKIKMAQQCHLAPIGIGWFFWFDIWEKQRGGTIKKMRMGVRRATSTADTAINHRRRHQVIATTKQSTIDDKTINQLPQSITTKKHNKTQDMI